MEKLLSLPIDASSHGSQIDGMLVLLHWLMAVLFVIWGIYFVYTLIRFRASKNKSADYTGVKTHASSYLEIAVAVFEVFLLVGFAIPVWSNVVVNTPAEEGAVVVHVVAEQFAWNVHYPGVDAVFGKREISLITAENPLGLDREDPYAKDDITTINQLALPVGKDILVYLTSKDVIHSFGIPLLRVKQDAIPGHRVPVWFKATLTDEEIKKQQARVFQLGDSGIPEGILTRLADADYAAADGTPVMAKGDLISEESLSLARQAGISEIVAIPDTPMEIACAQLCGLGHYRMRGTVTIMTENDYQAWLENEASYLEY